MAYKMKFELVAEARGVKKGLLAVLEARFAPLPADVALRLEAVSGTERLERLVRQAAVAPTLDDVLSAVDSTQRQQAES